MPGPRYNMRCFHLQPRGQIEIPGLVNIQKAIENGHRNRGNRGLVDLAMKIAWWIFPVRYVNLPEGIYIYIHTYIYMVGIC